MGWRLLHLLVLATLAVTQPLLSTLGENATFFVAHSTSPGQMIAFVILVSLAPTAVLGALMLAGHAVSAEVGTRVFWASMTVLSFVFVVQVVDTMPGPPVAVTVVAGAVSYSLMILYATQRPVRSAVSVLAVFPLVVVALFVFRSPASSIVFPDDVEAVALDDLLGADFAAEIVEGDHPAPPATSSLSSAGPAPSVAGPASATTNEGEGSGFPATTSAPRAPTTTGPEAVPQAEAQPVSVVDRLNERFPSIYIVVLDELPWASLLDEDGRIDQVRYPNFARLGATSHVFTNATTVAFTTEQAVPALLTGRLEVQPAPVFTLYPDNLFTLLGGVYDVSVSDPLVDLCPPSVCNGSPPAQVLELIAASEATPNVQQASRPAATTTTAAATASTTTTTAPATASTAATSAATTTATTAATTTAATTTAPIASRVSVPVANEARSGRGGSLSRLLKDAAIVFAHLAAPEGVDFGLPSIGSTWGSFGVEPVVRDLAAEAPQTGTAAAPAASTPITDTDAAAASNSTTTTATASTTTVATHSTTTAATTTVATHSTTTAATTTAPLPVDPLAVMPTGSGEEAASDPVDPERLALEREAFLDSLITIDTRVAGFRAEVAALTASRLPRLHYLHILLPHVPWRFRPDGSTYADIALPGYFSKWNEDPATAHFGQQRHLLQLGMADRLLGEHLDRLEAIGDFDRSFVIVSADHGISFVPGERSRGIGQANTAGIANVPLLYKEPGQRSGTVQPQPVELIDVVPTIAAALGLDPPWPFDGRDMFAADPARRRQVRGPFGIVEVPSDLGAVVDALAADMHAVFGDGASGSLYGLGGAHGLIGTSAHDWMTSPSEHCWTLERPVTIPEADGSIGYVYGRVNGTADEGIAVAVSVDGVVAATARSYRDGSIERVYAIGDSRFWRTDDPRVELHEIVGGRLAPISRC